jgi:hypothetical protein
MNKVAFINVFICFLNAILMWKTLCSEIDPEIDHRDVMALAAFVPSLDGYPYLCRSFSWGGFRGRPVLVESALGDS